jgi:hypothetical protein
MNAKLQLSLLSIVASCLVPGVARASGEATTLALAAPSTRCDVPEALSNLQRKVVEKAAQGTTALIRYIHGTRMMSYSLDVHETFAWLDQRRAARAACGVSVAAAAIE